jgi:hypothetical protein
MCVWFELTIACSPKRQPDLGSAASVRTTRFAERDGDRAVSSYTYVCPYPARQPGPRMTELYRVATWLQDEPEVVAVRTHITVRDYPVGLIEDLYYPAAVTQAWEGDVSGKRPRTVIAQAGLRGREGSPASRREQERHQT